MKKTVKSLIIAASVAAVAGIGAVSFAQWQASSSSVEKTGNAGYIATLGTLTVTPKNAESDGTTLKALVPVDQTGTYSGVTYWVFELKSDVTGGQEVVYKLKGKIETETDSAKTYKTAVDNTNNLYWAKCTDTTNFNDAPTAVPSDDKNKINIEDAVSLGDVGNGGYVYVYMSGNGTAGMQAKITLEFSAEKKSTT